ncbi:MAG TPA: LysM peptidoglycan-binding domain-containing protein [Anaerolineales bacterium]
MQVSVAPKHKILLAVLVIFGAMLACSKSVGDEAWNAPAELPGAVAQASEPLTPDPFLPATRIPGSPILTPTPDAPHNLPSLRQEAEQYVVQPGDTLNIIAARYNVGIDAIAEASGLGNLDYLEVGQLLSIPAPQPLGPGPGFKIIPDSELVFGPVSAYFDLAGFIQTQGGYLASYEENVDGQTMSGADIVARVAQEYSVNPRLLLAVLEYQSGWVTRSNPDEATLEYPMGAYVTWRNGLYRQLAWAADSLNRGYYLWRVNGLPAWILADGAIMLIEATINAGTAGVQHLFAQLYEQNDWEKAVGEKGAFAVYESFFGYPFDYAIEPLVPSDIEQPALQLPFEADQIWSYTGGPHGGWGSGSAWAALDFAPPGEALGCVQSDAWVVAVADGEIVRASNGAVVQDIDDAGSLASDGLEQTGWTVLYMHIESRGRVEPGTYLNAGERVGHPSCEGGVSTGTHVHLARRYNGEWIPADQDLPFVLDGWVSVGWGNEYDGNLQRNGQTVEAWEGRKTENAIQR